MPAVITGTRPLESILLRCARQSHTLTLSLSNSADASQRHKKRQQGPKLKMKTNFKHFASQSPTPNCQRPEDLHRPTPARCKNMPIETTMRNRSLLQKIPRQCWIDFELEMLRTMHNSHNTQKWAKQRHRLHTSRIFTTDLLSSTLLIL